MPRKPPHPCGRNGCGELTYERFCKKHQSEANANYDKYERDKAMKRFYNSPAWVALKKRKLSIDPFCELCKKSGTLVKATAVDHIQEIKQGGSRLDISNLQSLCWSCHSRKTIQERNKNKVRQGCQISTRNERKTEAEVSHEFSQNQKSNVEIN